MQDPNERRFHENVTITYPKDNTEPLGIECYVGEPLNIDLNSPYIRRYANEKGEIKIEFRVVDRKTGRSTKILKEVKNMGIIYNSIIRRNKKARGIALWQL